MNDKIFYFKNLLIYELFHLNKYKYENFRKLAIFYYKKH